MRLMDLPMRIMKLKMMVGCAASLLACSCGKKSPEAASHPATPAVDQNAAGQTASPNVPPPTTPPAYARPVAPPTAVQPIAVPADASAALSVLTQAVRKFSAERRQVPKNLNEVVNAGYIRNLPAAPPGKKFVLDTKRLEVTLANN